MPIEPADWGRRLEAGEANDAALQLAARLRAQRTTPPVIDESFRRQLRARLTTGPAARPSWRFALIGGGFATATAVALGWLILTRPSDMADQGYPPPGPTSSLGAITTTAQPCIEGTGPTPDRARVATEVYADAQAAYPGLEDVWRYPRETEVEATVQAGSGCGRSPSATPLPTRASEPGTGLPSGLIYWSDYNLYGVDAEGHAQPLGTASGYIGWLSADGEREYFADSSSAPVVLKVNDRRTGVQSQIAVLPDDLSVPLGWWPGSNERIALSGSIGGAGSTRSLGVVNARTSEISRFTEAVPFDASISFSPDGKTLAYTRPDAVVVVDTETGRTTTLTVAELDADAQLVGHVGWSRDGSQLAVEVGVRGAEADNWRSIKVVSPAYGSVREVLRESLPIYRNSSAISWSPGDAWLAVPTFQALDDLTVTPIYGTCFVESGAGATSWCADSWMAWSPDGAQAIVHGPVSGKYGLVQMGLQETRRLGTMPSGAVILDWRSPDQALLVSPAATLTPSPTAIPPLAYLWPRRLPEGYRIVGVWNETERGYAIHMLPPQQGREGGFALINDLRVGAAAEELLVKGADQPREPLTVRGQPGWVSGTMACWTELGNTVCLGLMQGDVAEILTLADGLDVVSASEWQALRQSNNTPTPLPYATPTPAAMLPDLPAGLGYVLTGQAWEVDAAGTPQSGAALPTGSRVSPDGRQALVERDADLWILDLATGETHNLTNTPGRIESGGRWWPERPGSIGYLFREEGTPPGNLDLPPTFAAVIQTDGSAQQTLTGPMDFMAEFDLGRDGDTVVYLQEGRIMLRRLAEAEPRQIDLGDALPIGARILNPLLSPDGGTIAARVISHWTTDNLGQSVLLIDLATGAVRYIANEPLISEGREFYYHPGRWTPDGTWILLFDESDYQSGQRPVRVADGQMADTLMGDVVVFSPDGRQAIVHEIYRPLADEQGFVLYDTTTWQAIGRLPLPIDAAILYWR